MTQAIGLAICASLLLWASFQLGRRSERASIIDALLHVGGSCRRSAQEAVWILRMLHGDSRKLTRKELREL
jgi:hypothetical protein